MGILLDGRTSQGASIANSTSVPTTSSNVLWGQVGLEVGAASPSFPIRVQFTGTIALKLALNPVNPQNTVEIKVVRGFNANDPVVYTARKTLTVANEGISDLLTFTGLDYNVPKGSGFLVYTVFVRNITGSNESDVTRVGPESFNVLAIGN
ncbi:hypothetical protein [Priestia aryabhattai]